MLHEVGNAEDFKEGEISVVQVDGKEIGIVRWHGEFHAVRNVCPHNGGYVCAFVRANLGAGEKPGTFVVQTDRPVVACAWHHWEFDLRDGRCVTDPAARVRIYPVVARPDGVVCVDLPKPKEAVGTTA